MCDCFQGYEGWLFFFPTRFPAFVLVFLCLCSPSLSLISPLPSLVFLFFIFLKKPAHLLWWLLLLGIINSPTENGNIEKKKKDEEERNVCVQYVIFPLASINVSLHWFQVAGTQHCSSFCSRQAHLRKVKKKDKGWRWAITCPCTNGKASAGCPAFRNQ